MEILNPTLDFFRKEISQCDHEQHVQRHSRQGNEQTFDPKTQEIEFVNEDEVKSHNENTMRRDESIQVEEDKPGMQIANLEEVGYASGPENLEHTTEPFINTKLIGKKRPRRRNKRSDGDDPVIRKKNVITKCEHTDQKYYAKGMCTNCYFKFGREKRATCCPDKPKYAKGVCQNCYMKKYSKGKRQQNKEAKR